MIGVCLCNTISSVLLIFSIHGKSYAYMDFFLWSTMMEVVCLLVSTAAFLEESMYHSAGWTVTVAAVLSYFYIVVYSLAKKQNGRQDEIPIEI